MSFYAHAESLTQQSTPFVVVTMAGCRGHAPQDPGAKAIVTAAGLEWGTVGGGRVEAQAIAYAQKILTAPALERGTAELVTWNLQRDVGMSCGGEVSLLFERVHTTAWNIALYGAGHVAQALSRQLLELDCQLTCIDTRPEWLAKLPESHPRLTKLLVTDLAAHARTLSPDAYCVIMTRGHTSDLPVLEAILKERIPPYIGVIGSDVKAIKIRKDLIELGVPALAVEALRCPMGLDIGNTNQPAEIGISIAAELIATRARLRASHPTPASAS